MEKEVSKIQSSEKLNVKLGFVPGFLGEGEDAHTLAEVLGSNLDFTTLGYIQNRDLSLEALAKKTLEEFAKNTKNTKDSTQKKVLMGYSLGGRILMDAVRQQSAGAGKAALPAQQIDAWIFVSSSPGLESDMERRSRLKFDEEKARALLKTPETFLKSWYEQPLFRVLKESSEFPDLLTRRQRSLKDNLKAWGEILLSASQAHQAPAWESLKTLSKPTLFVAGSQDERYFRIGERLSRSNPMIKLEVIKGADHAPHLTHPREMADVIRSFLASL